MKRVLMGLLAFAALLLAIAAPGLSYNTGGQQATPAEEPTRITRYDALFVVGADASMRVSETITVRFPTDPARRGIFRFFDRLDQTAPGLRRDPRDLSVERDGSPEPYTRYSESDERYTVLRIGSEAVVLPPGEHTYVITYTVDDVLLPVDATHSRLYWNLIPGGWDQRIDRARLTVRLPAPEGEMKCAIGVGATSGCTARAKGNGDLRVVASDLDPRTPVTLSVEMPFAAPPTPEAVPWTGRWDQVLGTSNRGLRLVLAWAALAGAVGLLLARSAHESAPRFPLAYAPPPGIGPAQAHYILTEDVERDAFVATVMYAADRGLVGLDRSEHRWTMTGIGDSTAGVDAVTAEVLDRLGTSKGRTFVARADKPSSGLVLRVAMATQQRSLVQWATDEALMRPAMFARGGILVGLTAVIAFGVALYNPFHMSVTALVPGVFALTALPLLNRRARTRRTAKGRDLWSQIGGFRRVLVTPSSQVRFDFSARRELYTAYLPWAVAFGVADQWAAKYRTETGGEPPAPAYLTQGYAGAHLAHHVDQMVDDFRGTVQSSISAYDASIRPSSDSGGSSSSSSGGGFSGGGGGGGGGGGSW